MSRPLAFLFAVSFLTFVGCAETGMVDDASVAMSERNDFKAARSNGSSTAWSSFLERYPQSSLRATAESGRDDAIWRETERTNTAAAYFTFAQDKPNHKMAGESKDRCRKLLEDVHGSEQDYLAYLRTYPDDQDAGVLRRALKTVRFEAAKNASTADGDALFSAEYPGTPEAAKLLPGIQARAYADAEAMNTRLAYRFFLKRYPKAAEAAQAQAKLDAFGAPNVAQGSPGDLRRLLPQLRRASPALARRECRKILTAKVRHSADLFGADAEELREQLKALGAGNSIPSACSSQAMTIPADQRQTAANAVRALALLSERQQYLSTLSAVPERIAANAEQTAGQADAAADVSETAELELEALSGFNPADPQHPDDTASKNDQEAARRARRAGELVSGMSKKAEIAELAGSADRQVDLLVEIIAAVEKPGAEKSESQESASDQPAASPSEAAPEAPAAEPAPAAEQQPAGDLNP